MADSKKELSELLLNDTRKTLLVEALNDHLLNMKEAGEDENDPDGFREGLEVYLELTGNEWESGEPEDPD